MEEVSEKVVGKLSTEASHDHTIERQADQIKDDNAVTKGGQTTILVRWSAAQRTTEMLADQRTGKNSGPAPAIYRN
jgi:hypothetical protein